MVPASATAAAVAGTVSCALSGALMISPGLPFNSPGNATKKVTSTTKFTGILTNCAGTQTGTKKGAQIDGGSMSGTAKSVVADGQPKPSCIGLATPTTPTVLKATVKFTSGGKALTKTTALLIVRPWMIGPAVAFDAHATVSGGAFKGQKLTTDVILDATQADLATLCTGGKTSTFDFTGVQGESTLAVAP